MQKLQRRSRTHNGQKEGSPHMFASTVRCHSRHAPASATAQSMLYTGSAPCSMPFPRTLKA
eukprot:4721440-Pyramimonas_sp.AAC.1